MFLFRSLLQLLDKLLFAALLVMGMQIPALVLQYQQILAAHYREAQQQLQQYQTLADRYYGGDLEQLLDVHRSNNVAAIRAEADILERLLQRNIYLKSQLNALTNKHLYQQLLHLMKHPDLAIAEEVYRGYNPSVPLTSDALIAGLTLAMIMNVALHIVLFVISRIMGPKRLGHDSTRNNYTG
ncbi:DUF2937 family protein [Methylomarinum vadi]|uniref:DUF2937 family protein n=1 Tax=Methylomarinum vadi TaxID=438855 RepID=UPI0004DF7D97|nr:DUF2937 family protein [Methylomarinum vadi]